MDKRLINLLLCSGFLCLPFRAQAQTFSKNDTVVESKIVSPVLASSTAVQNNPASITCGQFNDDDGDGALTAQDFLDCATLQVIGNNVDPDTSPPDICVLPNSAIQNGFPAQFDNGFSFHPSELIFSNVMGSLRSGVLNPPGFADLVAQEADATGVAIGDSYQTIFNADFVGSTNNDCTVVMPSDIVSNPTLWRSNAANQATPQTIAEHTSSLFDCDNDGDLDSVLVLYNGPDGYTITRNQNQGAGLEDITVVPGTFNTGLFGGSAAQRFGMVDTADFNGDGIPDVAVVSLPLSTAAPGLAICYGDGNPAGCGFTCNVQVNLDDFAIIFLSNTQPSSVVAGDFNGDGTDDIVVVLNQTFVGGDLNSVVYLFNNGSTAATGPNFSSASSQVVNTQPGAGAHPNYAAKGFFNNDDVPDLAVTNLETGNPATPATVSVINSDGSGGFLPVEILSFPPQPLGASFNFEGADAIETGDFDHCGGDDIVALAVSPISDGAGGFNPFKQAHFWMNAGETPVVNAGADQIGNAGASIELNADCSVLNNDPRNFTWEVIDSPAGATATFTPDSGSLSGTNTIIMSTFVGQLPGTYTLRLTCNSCGTSATDDVIVTLSALTQGGCIASLIGTTSSDGKGMWVILLFVPVLFLLRRFTFVYRSHTT